MNPYKDLNQKIVNDFILRMEVDSLANYHNKTRQEVKKALEPYIQIFYYRSGQIKKIKIDFLDTGSNIKTYSCSVFRNHTIQSLSEII